MRSIQSLFRRRSAKEDDEQQGTNNSSDDIMISQPNTIDNQEVELAIVGRTNSNDSNKLPILTASILENHREDVVDFDRSNINKYPKLSCNSCKETDIMIHKEEDLLGKSEVLKPQCCRVYSN